MDFQFSFFSIEKQLTVGVELGYCFLNIEEYLERRYARNLPELTVVTRVDIDYSCKKAKRIAEIFNILGIKGSFFVRLHAPEYNPFDFENYLCLKFIRDSGHELGYHSEIIDQATIWEEDPGECLMRDVRILENMLDIKIKGVASHRGMTGLNNLDFWKGRKPADFGLIYEAYEQSDDMNLFGESFYIADSEWTRWKCYDKGILVKGDTRTLEEHLCALHPLVYLLIHPDTYYERHFYE